MCPFLSLSLTLCYLPPQIQVKKWCLFLQSLSKKNPSIIPDSLGMMYSTPLFSHRTTSNIPTVPLPEAEVVPVIATFGHQELVHRPFATHREFNYLPFKYSPEYRVFVCSFIRILFCFCFCQVCRLSSSIPDQRRPPSSPARIPSTITSMDKSYSHILVELHTFSTIRSCIYYILQINGVYCCNPCLLLSVSVTLNIF